ncbi:hypothetical protein P389DRAFT_193653 [Cystobasidium minutum MCA 4210]|uniref:uncharacterized protein n=1 Tax=Cystobasidium minutum MCA 4210 TaxID=1397322 RepID=UPI0034CDC40E|eukprot:jgi/Rhomi1/193653/gm1.1867_g
MSKYEANAAGPSDAPPQYPAPGHLSSQGSGAPPSNQDYYGNQQPEQYGQYASGAPQSAPYGVPPQNQPYGPPPPLQQHPSTGSMYPPPPGSGPFPQGPAMAGSNSSYYGPQQGQPQQWPQPQMGPPYMQASNQIPTGYQQNQQQSNGDGAGVVAKSAGGSCLGMCLGCFATM